MRDRLSHVRGMAHEWGDWTRKGVTGLGYPSETAVSRLRTSPGRCTAKMIGPKYEPSPIARRFENAVYAMDDSYQQNLLFNRFVLCLSDRELSRKDSALRSESQARWEVEKALKAIAKILQSRGL